jgi:hypothetical protein
MSATPEQKRAVAAIANAIVDAVRAAGSHGAPGGVIYAAMMAHGCTLEQYEQFMAALVRLKRLKKSGDLYFVDGGKP